MKKNPQDTFTLNYVSYKLALKNKELDLALDLIKKALEIDSHLIYTKHNLANSYKNLFKYHLAEKLYLEVLAEKNDYQKCWYNYALLKQILNDYRGISFDNQITKNFFRFFL